MSEYLLDREILLDISVNIVPLIILFLFFLLILLADPFPWAPFIVVISLSALVIPFAFLALVTYLADRVIERDEQKSNR